MDSVVESRKKIIPISILPSVDLPVVDSLSLHISQEIYPYDP